LKKYGESIYATRGGPFVAPDEKVRPANAKGFVLPEGRWWGGSTQTKAAIYLHILRWPEDTLKLPAYGRRIARSTVLTGGKASVTQTDAGIQVSVDRRDPLDTIVKLTLA
jgi:alpha-L-fucosidase